MPTLINKKILVTGGTGLVGRALIDILTEDNRNNVITTISLDNNIPANTLNIKNIYGNLKDYSLCQNICRDQDIVFHLAGVRGSTALTKTHPYTFFIDNLQPTLNILDAILNNDSIQWGIYTSTIGTYGPAKVFREEDLWKQMPSKNDWYAGWAKRMGELQIDAFYDQYQIKKISIIKPSTIYGRYDTFNSSSSMVVGSLIQKAVCASKYETDMVVWGNGETKRDFIHATDVARAMIFTVENEITEVLNVGNGIEITIKELVDTILDVLPGYKPRIIWDKSKTKGDDYRILDINRLITYGFQPGIYLYEGIKDTVNWYIENSQWDEKYNAFQTN